MNRATFVRAIKVLLVAVVATPSVALAVTALQQQSSLLGLFAFFAAVPALFLGIGLFEAHRADDGDEFEDGLAYARILAGCAPRTLQESAFYADRQMNEALDKMTKRLDF